MLSAGLAGTGGAPTLVPITGSATGFQDCRVYGITGTLDVEWHLILFASSEWILDAVLTMGALLVMMICLNSLARGGSSMTNATAGSTLRVLLDSVLGQSIGHSELARFLCRSLPSTSLQRFVISKSIFSALHVDGHSLVIVKTSSEWILDAVLSMNSMALSVALRVTNALDVFVVAVRNVILGMLLKIALAAVNGSPG